ncbi:MAG: FecR domain-containing protein [Bacteroidales bacterium]
MEDKIWEIISSKLNGEPLSNEDSSLLDEWLNASSNNLEVYNKLNTFCAGQSARKEIDANSAYENVIKAISKKKTIRLKHILFSAISTAAVIVAGLLIFTPSTKDTPHTSLFKVELLSKMENAKSVVFKPAGGDNVILNKEDSLQIHGENVVAKNAGGVLYCLADNLSTKDSKKVNIIKTPIGKDYKVVLSDGTEVWLNSDTYLSFPSTFTGNERRIKLQGEALFKVTKGEIPFIVETGSIDVKVLGTCFDVKAYKDDDNVFTTLVDGSVLIIPDGISQDKGIDLLPNEQYVFNVHTKKQIIKEVNTDIYTAWTEDMFVFKNQKLHDVMKDLSRWYNIKYEFKDNMAADTRISGNIERNKGMDEIITMVTKLKKVDINKTGEKYIITIK